MVVQGAARERLVSPALGELAAHQLSSLTGSLIVLLATVLALPWLGVLGWPGGQLRIGACWLLATVGFEFGFGHFVAGHSWQRLLADYDLLAGRLWLVVLATTFTAPLVAGWLHGRRGSGS